MCLRVPRHVILAELGKMDFKHNVHHLIYFKDFEILFDANRSMEIILYSKRLVNT